MEFFTPYNQKLNIFARLAPSSWCLCHPQCFYPQCEGMAIDQSVIARERLWYMGPQENFGDDRYVHYLDCDDGFIGVYLGHT